MTVNALHIDTLKFSCRPIEADMDAPAAETLAEIDPTDLVTNRVLKSELALVRAEMRELEQRLTIKMGGMLMAAVAALTAILRLLPPAG